MKHTKASCPRFIVSPAVSFQSRPTAEVDGDAWGKTPIEITVQPRVVPMLVPG